MKSLYSIFAVCALTAGAVVSNGSPYVYEEAAQVDTGFHSFYDALESGNVENVIQLMTSSLEAENIIASIERLQSEVIDRSFILKTSDDVNTLKEFVEQDYATYLVVKDFFTTRNQDSKLGRSFMARKGMPRGEGSGREDLTMLLRVIGLLTPVKTLAEACLLISLDNIEIDVDIKHAITNFVQTLVCKTRKVRSSRYCGEKWHGGARACHIGKHLPVSLLFDTVAENYFNPKNEDTQSEECWVLFALLSYFI